MERRSSNRRIFKTRWFERFARKENIRDAALVDAVTRAESGQVDADLGGGVIKQRIARPGQGEVGRVPGDHLFPPGERAVLAYGFAKSERANIDADEEKQFKEAGRYVLRLTKKQIDELLKKGDLVEVRYEHEISK